MVYGTRLESVTRKGSWVRIPPPPPARDHASGMNRWTDWIGEGHFPQDDPAGKCEAPA